jgi:hypothetical protein
LTAKLTLLVRGYLEVHRDELDVADPDPAAFVCVTAVEALTHAAVVRRPESSPTKKRGSLWTTSRASWSDISENHESASGFIHVDFGLSEIRLPHLVSNGDRAARSEVSAGVSHL